MAAGRKRVTFKLQAPEGAEVFVAGSFNDWRPGEKRLTFRDGLYRATLFLAPGRHEYKFVVNGVWCVDPECPEWTLNAFGSLNSVITVGQGHRA